LNGLEGSVLPVKRECGKELIALSASDDIKNRSFRIFQIDLVMVVSKLFMDTVWHIVPFL
jgi:hypothetical protein